MYLHPSASEFLLLFYFFEQKQANFTAWNLYNIYLGDRKEKSRWFSRNNVVWSSEDKMKYGRKSVTPQIEIFGLHFDHQQVPFFQMVLHIVSACFMYFDYLYSFHFISINFFEKMYSMFIYSFLYFSTKKCHWNEHYCFRDKQLISRFRLKKFWKSRGQSIIFMWSTLVFPSSQLVSYASWWFF